MIQQQLIDSLDYIQERTDFDPSLGREAVAVLGEVFEALREAAQGDFDAPSTRDAVGATLKKAKATVPENERSEPNGWATIIVRTAEDYLG
jgi:hypothetical protein